jgi:hypothetical protein
MISLMSLRPTFPLLTDYERLARREQKIGPRKRASIQDFVSSLADLSAPIWRSSQKPVLDHFRFADNTPRIVAFHV